MIYNLKQYSILRKLSVETIRRRIKDKSLPSNHKVTKIPGGRGVIIIEIVEK